jgi:hypothetical protein
MEVVYGNRQSMQEAERCAAHDRSFGSLRLIPSTIEVHGYNGIDRGIDCLNSPCKGIKYLDGRQGLVRN